MLQGFKKVTPYGCAWKLRLSRPSVRCAHDSGRIFLFVIHINAISWKKMAWLGFPNCIYSFEQTKKLNFLFAKYFSVEEIFPSTGLYYWYVLRKQGLQKGWEYKIHLTQSYHRKYTSGLPFSRLKWPSWKLY